MEENLLLIERKDRIATLIFNRPEKETPSLP